jgi:hypothetical protein
MKNTVGKLFRDYHSPVNNVDRSIVQEFVNNPKLFLDFDVGLALDIKRLFDKRVAERDARKDMGLLHLHKVTDHQLE